jgi:hypothetical protein
MSVKIDVNPESQGEIKLLNTVFADHRVTLILVIRWEDNIKMDRREIRWEGVDWMHLSQDRDQWRALANTVMNLRVP